VAALGEQETAVTLERQLVAVLEETEQHRVPQHNLQRLH
jgi:hypothetical protein